MGPLDLIGAANRRLQGPHVREGAFQGGLPYFAFGAGTPLVVFRGLTPTNANPTGLSRRAEVLMLAAVARRFRVYAVNRRPGLEPSTTMADLAADHARALEDAFGRPVDVLGISTGGSVAQQFAADHPGLVRRLVLVGTAYKLGALGREVQRRYAELAARGDHRGAARALAPSMAGSRLAQGLVGRLLWVAAPLARAKDPGDILATILAEDAFDSGHRLGEITAPTLVIGGDRDRFYSPELFAETAARIPDARLRIYVGRGHGRTFVDRRFARDVIGFVIAERPTPS
jgi:pimeloyl-ACP methyl ester carboxylesterase